MLALTDLCTAAPASATVTTGFQPQSYEGSRVAHRAQRLAGRWICATDARGLTCVWEVDEGESAGGRASD